MELEQAVLILFDALELGPQFVQKQRADDFQNVRFGGVVGAQLAAPLARVQCR